MDHTERVRQQAGEYYNHGDDRRENGRLREIIERLRDEDSRQNHRLQELEDAVQVMKADLTGIWKSYTRLETALIGHNGENGIRGTMQEHYRTTNDRLDKMEASIVSVSVTLQTLAGELQALMVSLQTVMKVGGSIAGLAGFAAIIIGIYQFLSG